MIIQSKFTGLEADVDDETGLITLYQNRDEIIFLGLPPNARIEIIEKAIAKAKEIKKNKGGKE
jgi:hypothetical protein